MKILYLDCSMGAAGDMLTAALLSLLPDRSAALTQLNAIGIPGVRFAAEPAVRCGVTGLHVTVTVHGETEGAHTEDAAHHHRHHHSTPAEIDALINGLTLPGAVRADVKAVYARLAAAESRVHGVPVTEIHFHEVGTLDAVADIAAFCLLLHQLAPETVIASPVRVGYGQVRCAHGILSVPAPAAAALLEGVPVYAGDLAGEFCTPTGAALLRQFAASFAPMPLMTPAAVGYGMGAREYPTANCLRAFLGETAAQGTDTVAELRCNLDDMTGEEIAFAAEELLAAGALDVYTVPIGMKKGRPGVMLCVLCPAEARAQFAALLLRHTATLGVREQVMQRYTLARTAETAETPFGPLRCKTAEGYGVKKKKFEADDLAAAARKADVPLVKIKRRLADPAKE